MESLLETQKKLIPQVVEIMERRYSILRQISLSQPIGRRGLSNIVGLSERVVRTETEFLKEQNLIDVAVSGMSVTLEGEKLLDELEETMNTLMGISTLQEKVKNKLNIKKVLLIAGNYDNNESLLKDVAKSSAEYFLSILKDGDVVSITGGSTMLEFANSIKTEKKYNNVVVVPARGSMGKNIEIQSNNIVATISRKLNSSYKLLNIPDELSEESMKTLTQEPEIKNTLDYINKTDILVFGIGKADEMAQKRRITKEKLEDITSKGGVGEAFGHYFDDQGSIVCKLNTVGIDLNTFKNVKESIAVFAGSKKVNALIALTKINKNIVLITDEASAYKILEQEY